MRRRLTVARGMRRPRPAGAVRRWLTAAVAACLVAPLVHMVPAQAAPTVRPVADPAGLLRAMVLAVQDDQEPPAFLAPVRDLALNGPNQEVREAAKAALSIGTAEALRQFMTDLSGFRAKAEARLKAEDEANIAVIKAVPVVPGTALAAAVDRALAGGPQERIAFLGGNRDAAIATDVKQAAIDTKAADRVLMRVQLLAATGGPAVAAGARKALASKDSKTISDWLANGFPTAAKADADQRAKYAQALKDANDSLDELIDLAQRAELAARARVGLLTDSNRAVVGVQLVGQAMANARKAAADADRILADRKTRHQFPQNPDPYQRVKTDISQALESATWAADQARQASDSATTHAKNLTATGLTNGADWAQITVALAAAAKAGKLAVDTAGHAVEATLADDAALAAGKAAEDHAQAAQWWSEQAKAQAVAAKTLADAAKRQLEIATTAAAGAKAQRGIAQDAASNAQKYASDAATARANADTASATAIRKSRDAIDAQGRAQAAGLREQDAVNRAKKAGQDYTDAVTNAARLTTYAGQLHTLHATKQIAAEADGASEDAKQAEREAFTAWQAAETAASDARTAEGQAKEWADKASIAETNARYEAEKARAAADQATQDAIDARTAANTAAQIANDTITAAAQAADDAIESKTNAEAAVQDATVAYAQAGLAAQAAAAAAGSASGIADPARTAALLALPFTAITLDADLAIGTASAAIKLGAEQLAAARQKATEAHEAARNAQAAAGRATGHAKEAYQAAEQAATSATQAVDFAEQANQQALNADQDAAAARDSADAATRSERSAQVDAAGARQSASTAAAAADNADRAAKASKVIYEWAAATSANLRKFADETAKIADQISDDDARRIEAQAKDEAKQLELAAQTEYGFRTLLACMGLDPSGDEHPCAEAWPAIKNIGNGIGGQGALWVEMHQSDIFSALAGFLVGIACTALTAPTVVGIIGCGALAGAVDNALNYTWKTVVQHQGEFSWTDLGLTTAEGAILGGAGEALFLGGKLLNNGLKDGFPKLGDLAHGKPINKAAGTTNLTDHGLAKAIADFDNIAANAGKKATDKTAPRYITDKNGKIIDTEAGWGRRLCNIGGHSFAATTNVLMSGGNRKPINQIKTGDRVQATDPTTNTTTTRTVTATHRNLDNDLTDLDIRDQHGHAATLHTTQDHKIWNETRHNWTPANQLTPKTRLHTPTGDPATVTNVRSVPGTKTMYDHTIDTTHTYYVLAGNTPVLVHNANGYCGASIKSEVDGLPGVGM